MDNALQHQWDLDSVDFPLTEDSVVFEIGGYEGRWAKEIAVRFTPHMEIFEPQQWAYAKCLDAVGGHKNIRVHSYALGIENGEFPMGNWETDGCTFMNVPDNKPSGIGIMAEITQTVKRLGVSHIDLCLMNVEGYEFKLIPYMIETGIMDKIDYFMCQFHLNSASENEYHDLRRRIGKTKKVRFDYGPILTCWEPK